MKTMKENNKDKDFLSLLSAAPDERMQPVNTDMGDDDFEDVELTSLFRDYSPELSSDNLFMASLDKKLSDLELVKSRIETMHRQNRRAVIFAGMAGMICGIVFTLLYPILFSIISRLFAMITPTIPDISLYNHIFLLISFTALTLYTTFSTYQLVLKQE